jgi:hypothetical protein
MCFERAVTYDYGGRVTCLTAFVFKSCSTIKTEEKHYHDSSVYSFDLRVISHQFNVDDCVLGYTWCL